jgi:hypothetical protein
MPDRSNLAGSPTAPPTDPGEHVIQSWSSARGKRVADLDAEALEWAATKSQPQTPAGRLDKAAAGAYWQQRKQLDEAVASAGYLVQAALALGGVLVAVTDVAPPPFQQALR